MNDSLNIRELYEKLELDKPKVIGAVITKLNDKVNVCPVTFQVVSSILDKPLVICVGLSHGNYSLETILKTKEFVYSYPSQKQLKDIIYCGTVSGRNVNKLRNTSLKFKHSKMIKSPQLSEAVINFECTLLQEVKLENFSIIIGKTLHINNFSDNKLDKIYSLGEMDYGAIEKTKIIQKGRS